MWYRIGFNLEDKNKIHLRSVLDLLHVGHIKLPHVMRSPNRVLKGIGVDSIGFKLQLSIVHDSLHKSQQVINSDSLSL